MKNILTAIDFTALTEALLRQSEKLAGAFDAKVWLVHVASPSPDFVGYEVGPQHVRDDRAGELRQEHRKLQEYARRLRQRGIECEGLLVQGPLLTTLLDEARELRVDLLIVGAHRHSGLFKAFFGNTGEGLLRRTTLPVMVIPEKAYK